MQRGVVRWFLSWHDPQTTSSPIKLKKAKLPKSPEGPKMDVEAAVEGFMVKTDGFEFLPRLPSLFS